jgi:cytoskeletal protein CcmA (bactofilin family)
LISTEGNIHIEHPLTTGEITALNGRISSDSPLTASRISAKQLEVGNNLTVQKQIHVSKSMHVHGDVNCNRIQCLGALEVSGSVECVDFYAEGTVSVLHNVNTTNIQTLGSLSIEGHLNCDTLTLSEHSASIGQLKANTVTGNTASLTLKQGGSVPALHVENLTASGTLECKTIQATHMVTLSDMEIRSDVVFSEKFVVYGTVVGKILVLESPLQSGSHNIKGCLELSDFADFVPNIDDFLAERGLSNPSHGTANFMIPPTAEEPEVEDAEDSGALHVNLNSVPNAQSISEEDAPILHEDPDMLSDSDAEEEDVDAQPARIAVPLVESTQEHTDTLIEDKKDGDGDEDEEDNDTYNIDASDEINIEHTTLQAEAAQANDTVADDLIFEDENTPVQSDDDEMEMKEIFNEENVHEEVILDDTAPEEEPDGTEENPLFGDIRTQINTLADAYNEHPQGITELLTFLDSGDFETLREDLKPIWGSLIKFHQQENSRIPPVALQAFTKLDKLLKNL